MSDEHTPGSGWIISSSPDYFDGGATVIRRQPNNIVVAVITRTRDCEANARLIAAAPDLFQFVRDYCKARLDGDYAALDEEALRLRVAITFSKAKDGAR